MTFSIGNQMKFWDEFMCCSVSLTNDSFSNRIRLPAEEIALTLEGFCLDIAFTPNFIVGASYLAESLITVLNNGECLNDTAADRIYGIRIGHRGINQNQIESFKTGEMLLKSPHIRIGPSLKIPRWFAENVPLFVDKTADMEELIEEVSEYVCNRDTKDVSFVRKDGLHFVFETKAKK